MTIVSAFPRYAQSVDALPATERQKIDVLARQIARALRGGARALRLVRITGHADFDTPRSPKREYEIGLARAQQVRLALERALDRVDQKSSPAVEPPWSSRLAFDVKSVGAAQAVVPQPRSEADRLRNRRVEIAVDVPATAASVARPTRALALRGAGVPIPLQPRIRPWYDLLIDEFCKRAPIDTVDRSNCVRSVATKAIQLCNAAEPGQRDAPCCPPLVYGQPNCRPGRCYAKTEGAQILQGRDYRAPFGPSLRCCNVSTPCSGPGRRPINQDCAQCNLTLRPRGQYLVLQYQRQPLADMVAKMKCMLDRGCVVPIGVLSGICDDKPSTSCQSLPDPWKNCWEHWLLVIGYSGDSFLFWDSSEASALGPRQCDPTVPCDENNKPCQHWFGRLYYDATNDRLSTAAPSSTIDTLEVNSSGFHTQGFATEYAQKRFQVTSMWPGLTWKSDNGKCPPAARPARRLSRP